MYKGGKSEITGLKNTHLQKTIIQPSYSWGIRRDKVLWEW